MIFRFDSGSVMPVNAEAFQKVAERLRQMSAHHDFAIGLDTEVYTELNLYGLDLVELMLWMTKEFRIEGSIDIGPYGPPDVSWLLLPPPVLSKLRRWLGIADPAYKSLKVRDLLEFIENKHWPSN